MDTWAASSITPQICGTLLEPLGVSPAEFDRRYRPMSLRPNAHGIIRTWDFYTVVRSLYQRGSVPWNEVMISGHALDPAGKKISRSKLKTVADRTPLLEQYSADVGRYWAAGVRTGRDTVLNEEVFRNVQRLVTKLWNAARLILPHLQGYRPSAGRPAECNATAEAERTGQAILEVVETVRRWKAERKLCVGAPVAAVRVSGPPDLVPSLAGVLTDLRSVTRVRDVQVVLEGGGKLRVAVLAEADSVSSTETG